MIELTIVYLDTDNEVQQHTISAAHELDAAAQVERIFEAGLAFSDGYGYWKAFVPAARIIQAYHKTSKHPDTIKA